MLLWICSSMCMCFLLWLMKNLSNCVGVVGLVGVVSIIVELWCVSVRCYVKLLVDILLLLCSVCGGNVLLYSYLLVGEWMIVIGCVVGVGRIWYGVSMIGVVVLWIGYSVLVGLLSDLMCYGVMLVLLKWIMLFCCSIVCLLLCSEMFDIDVLLLLWLWSF